MYVFTGLYRLFPCGVGIEGYEKEPGAWGYNWATLPLGHINTEIWSS
jgi:hypothetical protein